MHSLYCENIHISTSQFWFFLHRMTHLNRYLVDHEFGGNASRVHGFAPKYENETMLSEKMKHVWPTIVLEKGL